MTAHLKLAIEKLMQSPEWLQDTIADQILVAIEAEDGWAERLDTLPKSLLLMADDAVAEKQAGLNEEVSLL